MLDKLTAEDFGPYVGQCFALGEEAQSASLELINVTRSRVIASQSRPGFSLVFRGAPEPMLPQGTHPVVHPKLGVLGIFLVPIGPDVQGMRYEAVFN